MPNGKKGYRVFLGKAYLGYYRDKKDAEQCVRESIPVASQCQSIAGTQSIGTGHKGTSSNTYKYVQARKNQVSTVYYGVVRGPMVQAAGATI